MAESRFSSVQKAAPIEVFALTAKYNDDVHPDKLNLGVGAYRSEEGKPWVLPVVIGAERQIADDTSLNHEYLPVIGLQAFREAALELLLGKDSPAIMENRATCVQALGGTGALRIAADFCKKMLHMDTVYVSDPTWGNHMGVFKSVGYSDVRKYRYWNNDTRTLDIDGMCDDISQAPASSVMLLHACAHNPTGVDPTHEQWERIAKACRDSGVFILIDIAYQGFSTGDLDEDAHSVRLFERLGFEFFVAQSFSKNFGLYNERVGALTMVAASNEVKVAIMSQMELIIRRTWSNPPNHGGRIVATVLKSPTLATDWRQCVRLMAERILLMRRMLFEKLKALGTPGSWRHIIEQTGMFSYTGLDENQIDCLQRSHHVYVMKSGRINMCGLTKRTVEYAARAIDDVVVNKA